MSNSPYIIDVSAKNFQTDVVEASHNTLVMVDFWATWCGPCKMLMPVVTKLATEYNGAFILAKVDIDQNQDLASMFAVRGVPAVKFIKDGKVIDEFSGAIPEQEIRKYLDKHVVRESDRLLDAAIAQYEAGQPEAAIAAIQEISRKDNTNPRLPLVYADLMIREKKYPEAKEVLQSLPYGMHQQTEVSAMLAKIELATAAADLPSEDSLLKRLDANPKDSEAHLQLGSLYSMSGDYEKALHHLMELVRTDRKYQDDAGRKAMLKLFDMLGDTELVHRYRRKMMASLY